MSLRAVHHKLSFETESRLRSFEFKTIAWRSHVLMVMNCACLRPSYSPYPLYNRHVSDIEAIGMLIFFGNDSVWGETQTLYHLKAEENFIT